VPDRTSHAVLEALGFTLFLRDPAGTLRLSGAAPTWLRQLSPASARPGDALPTGELSPVLENFLIDAEACWADGGARRIQSGPWVETTASGSELMLEATAMTAEGQPVLLLERLGDAYQVKQAVLQRARENVLSYQRLNSEMQKKEILLHCVAEDLTASLGNIITALGLLELETEPARTRSLLALASRATQEQQSLIGRVLDVFASELSSFYGREGQSDFAEVVLTAVTDAQPMFDEKRVKLVVDDAGGPHYPVAGDAGQFQRVMGNLLDNALQQTPPGCTVTIRREDTATTITISIEDEGPVLAPNVREKLFSRFEPGGGRSTASVLRLHFCRLTIENCQGELGCDPKDGRGNRFWISLPRLGSLK
jgi:hypothetical protein